MGCSAKAWTQAELLHGGRTLLSSSPRECGEQAYLDFTQLELYVRDALAQVLEHRPANPQQVLHDCIERTALGRQCAGREFTFVSANARNTLAFVQLVHEAYAKFHERRDSLLSIADFHQLLLLLCPDLPLELVERPARIVREAQLFEAAYTYDTISCAFFVFLYIRKLLPRLEAIFAVAAPVSATEVLHRVAMLVDDVPGAGAAQGAVEVPGKTLRGMDGGSERIGAGGISIAPIDGSTRGAALGDLVRRCLQTALGGAACRSAEDVLRPLLLDRSLSEALCARRARPAVRGAAENGAALRLLQPVVHGQSDGHGEDEDSLSAAEDACGAADGSDARRGVVGWEGRAGPWSAADAAGSAMRRQASAAWRGVGLTAMEGARRGGRRGVAGRAAKRKGAAA